MSSLLTPTVLTIAGSDPYGGAGSQIDAKVIHALGGYAFSVATALTAQNSKGVSAVQHTSPEIFRIQLETLLDDVKVDAVKIGMLANAELVEIVAQTIDKYVLKNIVLDTVLVSSSGKELLEPDAIEIMEKELFPRVDLITPNLPEINMLLKSTYVGKEDELKEMAEAFFNKGVKAVLVKGGHSNDKDNATDYLLTKHETYTFPTARVKTTHTHGTGCFLSSAIAAGLAKGKTLDSSVSLAKDFLFKRLNESSNLQFNYKDKKVTRKEALL